MAPLGQLIKTLVTKLFLFDHSIKGSNFKEYLLECNSYKKHCSIFQFLFKIVLIFKYCKHEYFNLFGLLQRLVYQFVSFKSSKHVHVCLQKEKMVSVHFYNFNSFLFQSLKLISRTSRLSCRAVNKQYMCVIWHQMYRELTRLIGIK